MLDRRNLLKLMSVACLYGCARSDPDLSKLANASSLKVVVVGAGIVGASIAFHLSKLGVSVTVIDKTGPATHSSLGTFAWMNASWAKQPKDYHALNQAGISTWKSLQAELNIPIKWGGSLEWFDTPKRQQRLADQIDEQIKWGEPARMIPVQRLREMEPKVDFSGVRSAAFSGNDGAVDPVLATHAFLDGAKRNGAEVKYPCELLDISLSGRELQSVMTNLGPIAADKVILATGAEPDTARRFAEIDLPQRTTPGVIAITKPMPPLLNRLIIAPGVHMHQRLDGRIVLGEQEGAPDTEAHAARLMGRPTAFPSQDFAEQHFLRMRDVAVKFLPEIQPAELEAAHIGWRPLPLDGHPVLGFSPRRKDIYLAVMHSGVSLAPIAGQLVAQEITSGVENTRLSQYRPGRDFNNVTRY